MPVVLPGLLVVAVALLIAVMDGGFDLTVWYPTALFLLALLAAIIVAAPPTVVDRSRIVEAALLCFGLLVAWALLSMIWAQAPGVAWDGANRMLLYLIALTVVCIRPWSGRDVTLALGLIAVVTTGSAIWLVVEAATSADPASLFIQGRLASPIGYLNASADLWLLGFFPAVHLALTTRIPWPVRGLSLGGATILLEMGLLSQSRGGAIALAATAVVYVAFTPRRIPALLTLGAAVLLAAVAADSLLDVRQATVQSGLAPAIDTAARALAATAVVAVVLGCAAALVGRRLAPELERRPGMRRGGDYAVAALGVLAVVAALLAIGNPATWLDARWDDFKNSGYSVVDASSSRFAGSLGSGRYDFYRVALNEFRAHPVKGIGADNFASEYLRSRRTGEAPRYPHSFVLMILSQLGLVGAVLLAAFLALMAAAAARARARATREHAAVVAAAFATGLVWLVHAAGDWLWEFPALGLLGLCTLAIAARATAGQRAAGAGDPRDGELWSGLRPVAPRRPFVGSVTGRLAMAVTALAAAISLSVPGVAARYVSGAYDDAAAKPDSALLRLDRAADINKLDAESLVAKGVIAQRLGRNKVAIDAFQRSLDRDPGNWFAHLELGLALALDGKPRPAEASIRRALDANPDQPITREVLRTVRRGEALSAREVENRLNAVLERRFNVTDPSNAPGGRTNGG